MDGARVDRASPAPKALGHSVGRVPALDAIRAVAVVRVIAWHTWRWWPLSWFAAMPAMFFVAGVLLGSSLERGGSRIIGPRLRRLLVPFWAYSVVAVTTMVAMGWRPGVGDLLPWILPFSDPVGYEEAPGLWIPLWYLRAYLWFLLAAPVLWKAVRRWRWLVPACFAATVLPQQVVAGQLPIPMSDFLAYGVFVSAGMAVLQRNLGSVVDLPRRPLIVLVVVSLIGAVVVAMQVGPTVNADYLLLVTAGATTVGVLLLASRALGTFATGHGRSFVEWISARALSLYLWQGFGLLAADRILTQRDLPTVAWVVASAAIVFPVTFLLAAVTAGIEDVAARRSVRRPSSKAVLGGVGSVVILGVALLAPVEGGVPTLPPSGMAALAAAAEVEAGLESDPAVDAPTKPRPRGSEVEERLLRDVAAHADDVGDALVARGVESFTVIARREDGVAAGATWTDTGGVVPGGFNRRVIWYSNAKAATSIWMLDLVSRGIVSIDDPVGRYLPEVPHGDVITLEHLSRHQSGIPSSADTASDVVGDAYSTWNRLIAGVDIGADVQRWLASGELVADPGTAWNYSRVGYAVLAWALERASGTSWQDAMRDLGRRADVELLIDEELAPAGTSNRHPGEGSYRGSLYAAGGIESSAGDLVDFFHWALGEFLGDEELTLMNTASTNRVLVYSGLGVSLSCPCEESDGVVRGRRVGNGGNGGGWRHDIRTGTTIGAFPDRVVDERGFIPEAMALTKEFFDTVDS